MSTSTTTKLVNEQIQAMRVSLFEIGVYKPAAEVSNLLQPEMLLRVWDNDAVMRSINWLRFQNLNGGHVYIRPKGEHPLSLLDDLTVEGIETMKAEGFHPTVVVQTSLGNFQAWVNHGEVVPKELSTRAAKMLANKFGADPSSADWRHFGRLAGFTNQKEKYRDENGRFPFVQLIDTTGSVYPRAKEFLLEVRDAHELAHRAMQSQPRCSHQSDSNLKTIAEFRLRPEYQNDGNRIDLAYAIYALSHGLSEGDVRAAIGTRDLSHKGNQKRQFDYIDRTLKKAWARVRDRSRER